MVVKELRQGLRTRMFGGVMLALHALLVLITLMTGASTSGDEGRGLMDGLITFVLCAIFPLCGFSALAGEIQANTMDMLVLTRLSTWRIVFGKWAAIVVQSLLVTVSVVPYLVARYVFGGSELMADLVTLFHQWLMSIVLTAGVVALSTQKHFWLRALTLGVPLLIITFGSFARLIVGVMGGSGLMMSVEQGWHDYLSVILFTIWLVFALLSFGASRIAPASSLLPVTKRLVHLAALFILSGLAWWKSPDSVGSTMMTVLVVAILDALMDDVNNVASLYVPFYRRGWLGRCASWFLAPGWMHGFLYSLLLGAISAAALVWLRGWKDAAFLWLVCGALWQAAFFAHILAIQRSRDYFGAIAAGVCMELLFVFLISLIVGVSKYKSELEWLYCLTPGTTLGQAANMSIGNRTHFELGALISVVWPLLLAIPAGLAFLRTRMARLQARQLVLSPHE